MAKVRLIAGEEHIVPELGDRLVQPDEVVVVPDARFDAYVVQVGLWEPVEEPKPDPETDTATAPEPELETDTEADTAPAPARARKATAARAATRKGAES